MWERIANTAVRPDRKSEFLVHSCFDFDAQLKNHSKNHLCYYASLDLLKQWTQQTWPDEVSASSLE
jgi:hypothetical protein